jgi:hypothetical protein
MSKVAQADMIVERSHLASPIQRRAIRFALYEKLAELGRVDDVDGYVVDPPDGPMRDPAYSAGVDFDLNAIVRIRGRVSPR